MKISYKKICLLGGITLVVFIGWVAWGAWCFSKSPQGKLQEFVSSGRESFLMQELIGNDWKVVCILPPSQLYPLQPATTIAGRRFLTWFEKSLGRPVSLKDYEWLKYERHRMSIVTDRGYSGTLWKEPWQDEDERVQMIFCTTDKSMKYLIKRKEDSYKIDSYAQRMFFINIGVEVNKDGM